MAESLRRYNLRDTRKKPQGELLTRWEMEYSKVISNENRRIPLEKVKCAIRSAFEDGMFEQWRITLKCPLSGQRIRVPARYADCTHIECFDLEAFLRMKTQKNLWVCPICQKEVEKPLANLRIEKYIETALSTLPDALQVELMPDGSFIEVHEGFVEVPNVINDEEPFVQDSYAPALEVKQEVLEDDDECTTLSDGEIESMEEIAIVDMKPIYLMPLDIKTIAFLSEPELTRSIENQEIRDHQNIDSQKTCLSRKKRIHLTNAFASSVGGKKKRRVPVKDKQSEGPSADVNAHFDQSSSETSESSDSSEDENNESRTYETDRHRTPNVRKMKITTIGIDIYYGTASFRTSESKYYRNRPLRKYVSILRESEADIDCQAHISFETPHVGIWDEAELRVESVLGSRKKFEQFLEDVRSISHLWENGCISLELCQYSDNARVFISFSDFCEALFGRERSILKCKVLEVNWLNHLWLYSVITNVVRHCNQLIFKQKQHPRQHLYLTFLAVIYTVTLPHHLDVILEINQSTHDFVDKLQMLFRRSRAHYLKFKLFCFGFSGNKLLRNYYGTLEMTNIALRRDDTGLLRDIVMIEQCPYTSLPDQQPT